MARPTVRAAAVDDDDRSTETQRGVMHLTCHGLDMAGFVEAGDDNEGHSALAPVRGYRHAHRSVGNAGARASHVASDTAPTPC